MPNELGKPLKCWEIKSENDGKLGVYSTFKTRSGQERAVSYCAGYLDKQHVYIIQVISDSSLSTLLRYGSAFYTVAADVEKTLHAVKAQPTHTLETVSQASSQLKKKKKVSHSRKSFEKREHLSRIRLRPETGVKDSDIEVVFVDSDDNSIIKVKSTI